MHKAPISFFEFGYAIACTDNTCLKGLCLTITVCIILKVVQLVMVNYLLKRCGCTWNRGKNKMGKGNNMTKAFDISKFRKSLTKGITGISTGFNDPKIWLSTGSYGLNYLISGDFYKGVPMGKVTVFAGESGSGKSYIVSGNIVKSAQEQGIFVVLLDSENSLDKFWLNNLGVSTDEDKLLRISASMIDDVAKVINDFVKEYKTNYLDLPADDRPKVLFVIDSLGMLLSATEVNQFEAGDMKGDMGRKAKQLKALVTNCLNMFGDLDIGMVVTNHTYASQDMFDPDDKISGGCLIPGTMVSMGDGTKKSIETIQCGDVVQTLEGPCEVAKTFTFEKDTYELQLEDGSVLVTSAEHRFMVKTDTGYAWKTVAELQDGESIIRVV